MDSPQNPTTSNLKRSDPAQTPSTNHLNHTKQKQTQNCTVHRRTNRNRTTTTIAPARSLRRRPSAALGSASWHCRAWLDRYPPPCMTAARRGRPSRSPRPSLALEANTRGAPLQAQVPICLCLCAPKSTVYHQITSELGPLLARVPAEVPLCLSAPSIDAQST